MSEQAGQSSHRTPDFIPGWFGRRGPDQIREAVRVEQDAAHFPVHFLRGDEFVRPAVPGRHGVTIGRVGRDMELAVPPGYWIVRGEDDELRNWRPEDFREQFCRLDTREWEPPSVRDRARVYQPTGCRDDVSGIGAVAPSDEHAAAIGGWKGTQPAEGTRRALIYGALLGREVLTADECLDHADAIESALLDSQIAVEAAEEAQMATPPTDNPYLPPEYKQRIVDGALEAAEKMQPGDVGEIDDPDAPDAEIVDSDGHPLAGLHVVLGAQDGVPYLSLIELEHLFANLYEDITERQAKRQRRGEEEKAENARPYDREEESVADRRDGSEPEDAAGAAADELMRRILAGELTSKELAQVIVRLG